MSESETPRGPSSKVQRRNILDALTGSQNSDEETADRIPTVAQQKAAQQELLARRRMAQSLEILGDRQALLIDKLLRMRDTLQEEDISIHLLKLHVETLRRTADEFEKVYAEMSALLTKEQREAMRVEYGKFEAIHNEVYVALQTRIDHVEQQTKLQVYQNVAAPQASSQAPVYVQAPAPHLQAPFPTFNGTLENWFSFKSLFQSIMARYTNETDAMKILHLRNSLTGEAKDKIDQEVVNNGDYASAWKILEDAYEDKRLIMDTHIDAILDCPRVTKDNRGKSLSKLVELCVKHTDALNGHGFPVEGLAELILVNVLYKKLDKETQELWETKLGSGELPDFEEFVDFLRERGRVLQRTNRTQQPPQHPATSAPTKRQQINQKSHSNVPSNSFVQVAKEVCPCCKAEHSIYRCVKFQGLSSQERKVLVAKANLCFNCLKSKHRVVNCPSEQGCKVQGCGRKHHSLLHSNDATSVDVPEKHEDNEEHATDSEGQSQKQQKNSEQRSGATTLCASISGADHRVILSTAQVLVTGKNNELVQCRALLDSGSDSNIITEQLAGKLQLNMVPVDVPISGLNNSETRVKFLLATKFQSCNRSFASPKLEFLVVPNVTSNLPVASIDSRSWRIPSGLHFADPKFHSPGEIDMVIGNEVFFDLIKNGRIKLGVDGVTLAETKLGWIVAGSVPIKGRSNRRVCQLNRNDEMLNQTMSKFWELESVYPEKPTTVAEAVAEEHFKATHYRESSGRYVVRLPFNGMESQLGDSYDAARKRLNKLMLQLARNPIKCGEYYSFLSEYLALGHMAELPGDDTDGGGYYIPHHAVYKASSSTTRTRVVFDASAKTTTGYSLNDTLLVGPTVQNDIVSIILRFCTHSVALTADISKMYRQVWLHKDDCKYQQILWWDGNGHLKVYQLQTVTYGVASSPYHATRVLVQLAADEGDEFALGKVVITEDSYIDDFLTGGSSSEAVIRIYSELSELLRRGGFAVHKFCSNSVDVLKAIPEDLQEQQVSFDEAGINNSIKTLGLIWNPQEDYFMFRAAEVDWTVVPTKRKVLSEIGQLFDPLGFLGPAIVFAKLVMQDIWRLGIEWDQELPQELLGKWNQFRQQLPALNQIRKPRCVTQGDAVILELHGFSDASQRAYGAVVYVRSIAADGTVYVNLVASKSRVAPLKPTTIPRLELCGAKLLAELVQKVIFAMKIQFDAVKLWCDSQIVLCWLRKSPLVLNQFVAKRVVTIVELTQSYQWGYIRSEENPADAISRGELPEDLQKKEQWWKGAQMLWEQQLTPRQPEAIEESMIPEVKAAAVVMAAVRSDPPIMLNRLSNYRRIQRAWVYVHRYIDKKVHKKQEFGDITADEIRRAERSILLIVQRESYGDVLKALQSKSVQRQPYRNLALFVGDDGLIRVGGRLKYSAIPYDGKHQVLLPQKHHITETIVRGLHQEHFHVGQNGLLAIVREHYWPVHAQQLIKKVVSSCQVCARQRPRPGAQFMGDLPEVRVQPAPPFSKVGIDYAGPFMLKMGGRSTKLYKGYVVVFVCLVVKTIHFELVSSLSTDNFIAALQRFSSRRGLPSDIHSDNATTFVGANHELAALRQLFEDQQHQLKIKEFCSTKGIRWHFIPPRSPHFGGIWEAGVKSMKYHLKRVVGETRLTFEEMTTFLAQTEAILNSRPLYPMSEDPSDYSVLTPSHFLIGRSGVALPVPAYGDEKVGRLDRYQHVQLMHQHFWDKWSREYLHHLQGRQKWNTNVNSSFKVGALVLLIEENLPPQQWKRGRIAAVHPGKDDVVRVVTVKTATGDYKRAVAKIAMMPSVETELSTGGE